MLIKENVADGDDYCGLYTEKKTTDDVTVKLVLTAPKWPTFGPVGNGRKISLDKNFLLYQ